MTDLTLILQRSAPYGSLYANESLDLGLGFAVMDCDVAMAFIDDGVYQLVKQQAPTQQKNLAKNLSALPLYGIEQLYCEQESLDERHLTLVDIVDGVAVVSRQQISTLIQQSSRCFAL